MIGGKLRVLVLNGRMEGAGSWPHAGYHWFPDSKLLTLGPQCGPNYLTSSSKASVELNSTLALTLPSLSPPHGYLTLPIQLGLWNQAY